MYLPCGDKPLYLAECSGGGGDDSCYDTSQLRELIQRSITHIDIPQGTTNLGGSVFGGCTLLESATIPDSVTRIEGQAFADCYSLSSIIIPNSVTEISDSAFSGCMALTNIQISDSITRIGAHAFFHCISLTSITIPDSITVFGNYIFMGCNSLTSITIEATTPPTVQTDTFTGIPENAVIYVPSASVDAYKSANKWSNYASRIQGF